MTEDAFLKLCQKENVCLVIMFSEKEKTFNLRVYAISHADAWAKKPLEFEGDFGFFQAHFEKTDGKKEDATILFAIADTELKEKMLLNLSLALTRQFEYGALFFLDHNKNAYKVETTGEKTDLGVLDSNKINDYLAQVKGQAGVLSVLGESPIVAPAQFYGPTPTERRSLTDRALKFREITEQGKDYFETYFKVIY